MLARLYEVFPLVCANYGEQMRIIAFITDAASIDRILSHILSHSLTTLAEPAYFPSRGPLDVLSLDERILIRARGRRRGMLGRKSRIFTDANDTLPRILFPASARE